MCGDGRVFCNARPSSVTIRRVRHPLAFGEMQQIIAQRTGDYSLIGDTKNVRLALFAPVMSDWARMNHNDSSSQKSIRSVESDT